MFDLALKQHLPAIAFAMLLDELQLTSGSNCRVLRLGLKKQIRLRCLLIAGARRG
jgi:hypothetical protein